MLLGCIVDDFTGASDIAAMLVNGGMRTIMVIGVPTDADAVVVALKSRSIPAADAVAQSLAALDWLLSGGCRQVVFKYCSTFDSTPAGNIGPVAEALAERLDTTGVVVCPAFPAQGRTVYQGHLFVRDRLLSESGMERHPLHPMTDPDIRRWLRKQTKGDVGHVPHEVVARGPRAIRAALAETTARLVVVDAIDDGDLIAIGRSARDAPLVTGGSGIAMGLPQNFRETGSLREDVLPFVGSRCRAAVLAGSRSEQTREQIAHYARHHPSLAIFPKDLMAGKVSVERVLEFVAANAADAPLIYASSDRNVAAGSAEVAHRLEAFFGDLARQLVAQGIGRLVVAGGETSGAVVNALGLRTFEIGPEIATGVPALVGGDGASIVMALKSGNFGKADFFERALAVLAGKTYDQRTAGSGVAAQYGQEGKT